MLASQVLMGKEVYRETIKWKKYSQNNILKRQL